MSVNSMDMQMATKEVLSSADGPLSAQEEASPIEVDVAPEFSSPPGLSKPSEVKEVTLEMQQLIESVSLELARRAESFASSHFTTENDDFEFEYVPAMLPSGLTPPPGLDVPPGLFADSAGISSESMPEGTQDDDEVQTLCPKMDGNESSDESTNDDSQPDGSTKAETTSASASPPLSDDEDESINEVPELPDMSAKALSLRKQEKFQARRIATATANNTKASTRIVFGDQGAKLAAQAAQAAKLAKNGGMSFQPPPDAVAYGWHPYYGYVAW